MTESARTEYRTAAFPASNLDGEKLEHAAKALDPWSFASGVDSPEGRHDARIMARAAITAYLGETHVIVPREPTDPMLNIDAPDMPAGGGVAEIWRDMIEASLST